MEAKESEFREITLTVNGEEYVVVIEIPEEFLCE